MKWGWTTSSNNLESVLPLQDIFNNYFYNNGKYSKCFSNKCKNKNENERKEKKKDIYKGKKMKGNMMVISVRCLLILSLLQSV